MKQLPRQLLPDTQIAPRHPAMEARITERSTHPRRGDSGASALVCYRSPVPLVPRVGIEGESPPEFEVEANSHPPGIFALLTRMESPSTFSCSNLSLDMAAKM